MKNFAWVIVFLIANHALMSAAQEKAAQDKNDDPREARLQRMRRIVDRVNVTVEDAAKPRQVPLLGSSLLRFSDPTRELHDATLWAWGEKGRPACLMTVELYGGDSHFEFISLNDSKLTAALGDLAWNPESAGLTFQPFPTSSLPVSEAPRRLAQMKELMGKLSAYEIRSTGRRFELRLLPTPVHRYEMPSDQLLDGAIFAFVNGTNPELLVVIEARGEAWESAKWQIGFVRSGGAELHALLEDKELFQIALAGTTGPTKPYWIVTDRNLETDD